MHPLPLIDPDSTPIRAMALRALGWCERLFYLEEVEQIQVANEPVLAGRQLHAALEAADDAELTSLDLASSAWGLVGRVDALRRRDGSLIPYEHKRGKAFRQAATTDAAAAPHAGPPQATIPSAWPSDRLQIIAYAVLIEEAFRQPVAEGRIRYHADNLTVRVPIDEQARADLRQAIIRARHLRQSLDRPPITQDERRCVQCSLAPVCLPEETRRLRQPERQIQRLFPPDRDGVALHVISQGAKIGMRQDSIVIAPLDPRDRPAEHPLQQIESILIHGFAQISTQALHRCAEHDIAVHWLSLTGRHRASLVASAGQVQRRIRQFRALTDEATRLRLARTLVQARIDSQYRYLLRASRSSPTVRARIQADLTMIQQELQSALQAPTLDALRGHEGAAAAAYFRSLPALLSDHLPDELRFDSRSRRPPRDRVNAVLNFLYGLLYAAVLRALLAVGLEPAFGFFHTPRSAAHPLVLDLMELFRVPLADMVLVASLNRLQWNPQEDFSVTPTMVWLSDAGRRKAIQLWETRLAESWKHPVLNYSLSYARSIELEARLLEKEWSGEPGLFAQARIR